MQITLRAPNGLVVQAPPDIVTAALVTILTPEQQAHLVENLLTMKQAKILGGAERPPTMPTPAIVAP